ncbi:MAG TPA: hypothetical protein VFD60_02545 [Nitrososphaeraceae archaeon]|nr:hypothetical protein [Nitrososphaeraceae archaeon]
MSIIPINYVGALCYSAPCPANPSGVVNLEQQLVQAHAAMLPQQVNQLEEQHTQDLQMIYLLISIIAGLSSGIIALSIIFLKIRKWYRQPTPETEHREDQ